MNAMDKLSAVVIQADSRISDSDREFCQAHQSAYEAAKEALMELGAIYRDITDQQEELLPPAQNSYESKYIEIADLRQSEIERKVQNLHSLFINKLVSYFNSTYNVSISAQKIKDKLIPKEPESSRIHYDKEVFEQYYQELLNMTVRYENVLDLLFIQLGGRTFAEKAFAELQESCHSAAWCSYKKTPEYEVKGDTIRFTFCACSCDSWTTHDYWKLTDAMCNVLRGIAHYETGMFSVYPHDISALLHNRHDTNPLVEFPYCSKVKQLKMFKNHRVDLKFESKTYASEFAAKYLGLVYQEGECAA